MENRRDFIKKAALLSGALGLAGTLPPAIQKALAINPAPGTTWKDAEHVVILMQENRSFDHLYGSLQGVRGFNDPRAITLPDNKSVFLQTNKQGETFAPFRLNIKDTRATWMGSLPHAWPNQVDARNDGKMDRWLDTKQSGHEAFSKMPLTLGYYNREDLPFYYSLADAFTVCDQNFCSSLTGTTPNRLYLWTGTIREAANEDVHARVMNEDADYATEVSWTTFPERLDANGISWKVYQNEVSVGVLDGDEDGWLANFGDNPLEYFTQFNIRFLPAYMKILPAKIELLKTTIARTEAKKNAATGDEKTTLESELTRSKEQLARLVKEQQKYTPENYKLLSEAAKKLHEKAFVTNTGDPHYHELESLRYQDGSQSREVKVPKGDVFYQFRKDVTGGKLPAVSWLVAPENLSDHPSAPWYGAAYVSEAMDILTQNPEVWKKTVFILCYDENDGYFDHVAPFTAPHPGKPETGSTSKGIDTSVDFVKLEQDKKWKPADEARESSIGLGFRVPLVIASPWSRGGAVNSQVFDHTSVIQFIEKLFTAKTGKKLEEPNISAWRRTVCGDLTSVFTPWHGETITLPKYIKPTGFYEEVHQAKFKNDPGNFRAITPEEIKSASKSPTGLSRALSFQQEKGARISRALPYELSADGKLKAGKTEFSITMRAGNSIFGKAAAGSPFSVYAYGAGSEKVNVRAFAVAAGDQLTDVWSLKSFDNGNYHLKVYGPNGFFREFKGSENDPSVAVEVRYESPKNSPADKLELIITNASEQELKLIMPNHQKDNILSINNKIEQSELVLIDLKPSERKIVTIDCTGTRSWYDFSVESERHPGFHQRFAGRIENGREGWSDPVMGG